MGSLSKFLGKPKEIEIDGEKITLQPIKVKDMAEFVVKDPTPQQSADIARKMVKYSVPDETDEVIDELPLDFFTKLVNEINKFNGFEDEQVATIADALKRKKAGS